MAWSKWYNCRRSKLSFCSRLTRCDPERQRTECIKPRCSIAMGSNSSLNGLCLSVHKLSTLDIWRLKCSKKNQSKSDSMPPINTGSSRGPSMTLNLLSLLVLPFPPPQYVLGGYPSQWTLFFRQCSHVGLASSHFFFRLLQVMQPVLLRPLGGFASEVICVLGCFRGRPRGLRESICAGASSVIVSGFSSISNSPTTSSSFGMMSSSAAVRLEESLTWLRLRANLVAVLGDSLEGLGLAEVNGDEDEDGLARRSRSNGASGPNIRGCAIYFAFTQKSVPTTNPRWFPSMAMPKCSIVDGCDFAECRNEGQV